MNTCLINDEELKKKEEIFKRECQAGIRISKRRIRSFIELDPSFQDFRKSDYPDMSRLFQYKCQTDLSFRREAGRILDPITPMKMASSTQDVYHHLHFISTFLLHLLKDEGIRIPNDWEYMLPWVFIEPEPDELQRLEMQRMIYAHLSTLIPKRYLVNESEGEERATLKRLMKELKEIKQMLKEIKESQR